MNEKKVLFINEETTIPDTYHYPFLLNKGYADSDKKVLEDFSNQPFDLVITDFGKSYIRILLTKRKW